MMSIHDIFKCKIHKKDNCKDPGCKEIAALEWSMAMIIGTAKGVVDRQYKKALDGCARIASEALSRGRE